jgi:tetratricopeptide (TPR) repeat protein
MKSLALILIACMVKPVFACPELPNRDMDRAALLQELKEADTYTKGTTSIASLWLFWRMAPDEIAQEMLDDGLASLRVSDYLNAEDKLSRLVKYCPDYAEGYNQLAFVKFLQGQFEESLSYLDRALGLEPHHFGALSGKALNYIELGRNDIGQVFLRRAVAINPWLNERFLLQPTKGTGEL